jgi:hypothetical protein
MGRLGSESLRVVSRARHGAVPMYDGGRAVVTQCCECKRVLVGEEWRPCSQRLEARPIIHGYCPTCFDAAMDAIDAMKARLLRMETRGAQ